MDEGLGLGEEHTHDGPPAVSPLLVELAERLEVGIMQVGEVAAMELAPVDPLDVFQGQLTLLGLPLRNAVQITSPLAFGQDEDVLRLTRLFQHLTGKGILDLGVVEHPLDGLQILKRPLLCRVGELLDEAAALLALAVEEDLLDWDLRGIGGLPFERSCLHQLVGHLGDVERQLVVLEDGHASLKREGERLRIMLVLRAFAEVFLEELWELGLRTSSGSQNRSRVAEDLLLLIRIAQVETPLNIRRLRLLSCLRFDARRNPKQLSQLGMGQQQRQVLERGDISGELRQRWRGVLATEDTLYGYVGLVRLQQALQLGEEPLGAAVNNLIRN